MVIFQLSKIRSIDRRPRRHSRSFVRLFVSSKIQLLSQSPIYHLDLIFEHLHNASARRSIPKVPDAVGVNHIMRAMVPLRCRATNPAGTASASGQRCEHVIGASAPSTLRGRRYRRGSVVRARASSSDDAGDVPSSEDEVGGSRREGGESDADGGSQKRSAPRLVPFAVRVATPPPTDLGTHKLPKNTSCGETIEVDESWFIVDRVTTMYNLVRGKYRKDGSRLDVQRAERFFVNASLEAAFAADSAVGYDDDKDKNR